ALAAPVVHGWVLLAKASTCDDLGQVQAWAREAHQVAIDAQDRDLELCALSTLGSALTAVGRVQEGAELLDEALAGALGGEVESLDTVVYTGCLLMRSCYRSADFLRVVQWAHALDGFIARYGCPYVHATCRASYGAVLVATGDWVRGEAELLAARELAGAALPAVRAEVSAYLADLRLGQGRVDEARALVAGFEDQPVVLPVLAAVQLAGGDVSVAASTVRRRLAEVRHGQLESARLREVLGEACLSAGDTEAAVSEGRHLAQLGATTGCHLIAARGERLLGRSLLTRAEAGSARRHLEAALGLFVRLELPLEVARTRQLLAEAMRAEEPEVAVAEARAALAVFEDLGAERDADASAAWLRGLGATAGRPGPKRLGVLTARERAVLALIGDGLSNPEIGGRLYISRRTAEHHVASILSKLGLRNRVEAAAYAVRHSAEGAEDR
ncbi:MAG: response regulator transcription factor, partial [Sporichthyaceae bacterium]|nr:response regulator transcription factor [Sporichthyaceae bacterium]